MILVDSISLSAKLLNELLKDLLFNGRLASKSFWICSRRSYSAWTWKVNAPLRGSRVILSLMELLEDASMALYPPMLFWLAAEVQVTFCLAHAAAKSLKEFCLANSLKADSKLDGAVDRVALLTSLAIPLLLWVTEDTYDVMKLENCWKSAEQMTRRGSETYRFDAAASLQERVAYHRCASGAVGVTIIIIRIQIGVWKFISRENRRIRLRHHNHDVGGRGIVKYQYHDGYYRELSSWTTGWLSVAESTACEKINNGVNLPITAGRWKMKIIFFFNFQCFRHCSPL